MHSQPHTKVGTISYMAPEVTEANNAEPYDGQAADVWSLGVILYVLVSCSYPFGYDGPKELGGEPTHIVYGRIREGRFNRLPPSLSAACQGLIAGMLTVDPKTRLSVRQVLEHPWLRGVEAAHGRQARLYNNDGLKVALPCYVQCLRGMQVFGVPPFELGLGWVGKRWSIWEEG